MDNTSFNEKELYAIGKRLKDLREESGENLETLAELISVHGKVSALKLGRWELGRMCPPLPVLLLLATALNTTVEYIILGKNTENKGRVEKVEVSASVAVWLDFHKDESDIKELFMQAQQAQQDKEKWIYSKSLLEFVLLENYSLKRLTDAMRNGYTPTTQGLDEEVDLYIRTVQQKGLTFVESIQPKRMGRTIFSCYRQYSNEYVRKWGFFKEQQLIEMGEK